MTKNYIVDIDTSNERTTTDIETSQISQEIHDEFNKEGIQVMY
jgi:hypothetical protein